MSIGWPKLPAGNVSDEWGMRMHPIYHEMRLHAGIDLRYSLGEPIAAAESGVVTFSGYNGGQGNATWIQHDDGRTVTKYFHASKLLTSRGQRVAAGQTIAEAGTTGDSTGVHLHFEVWVDGININPRSLIPANVKAGSSVAAGSNTSPTPNPTRPVGKPSIVRKRKMIIIGSQTGDAYPYYLDFADGRRRRMSPVELSVARSGGYSDGNGIVGMDQKTFDDIPKKDGSL